LLRLQAATEILDRGAARDSGSLLRESVLLRHLNNLFQQLWLAKSEEVMHDHKGPQLIQIEGIEPQLPKRQPPAHAQKPHDHSTKFLVGLDVGSTTVKAVVVDAASDQVLWQDYQRHETKQPEKTLEFLKRIEAEIGINSRNTRMFMTGSGGGGIAEQIGAKFVQEVTAVSLAVEKMHPEVYSVVELGGQDAKIIVFKDDEETGRKI
jgi:activator of 2-hydroxyglutaryl-CoA dehydratase